MSVIEPQSQACVNPYEVFVPLMYMGEPSGVATLDSEGLVPADQIPVVYDPLGSAATNRRLASVGPSLPKGNGTTYTAFPGQGANGTMVASEEVALPFWCREAATLESIIIHVVTGGAGSVVRFGLRADAGGTNPYPGALIDDYGTSATATSSALASKTGLTRALSALTIYWLTFTEQGGTPPVVASLTSTGIPSLIESPVVFGAAGNRSGGYKQTGVTGALGSPFSSTVLGVVSISPPKPTIRLT